MTLVLGVDGGGTKTDAAIAQVQDNGSLRIVARGRSGSSNVRAVGWPSATAAVLAAIAQAQSAAEGLVDICSYMPSAFALAGAGTPQMVQRWTEWIRQTNLGTCFVVVHDARGAIRAGSVDDWGIALVAGTGSLAFGRARDGQTGRVGGWGYLLGDEGSGYALGMSALRAVVRAADGRGANTILSSALIAKWGLSAIDTLVDTVYGWTEPRGHIAELADIVVAAAPHDATAKAILDQAGEDLAELVITLAQKLKWAEPFPLVFSGGVILGSTYLQRSVTDHLSARGIQLSSVTPVTDPVIGPLLLARDQWRKTQSSTE